MRKTNVIQPSYSKRYVLFGSHKPNFLRKFKHYHKHLFFPTNYSQLLLLKNGNYYWYKGKKGVKWWKFTKKPMATNGMGQKALHQWCQFAHPKTKPFRVTSSDENIHWSRKETTSPPPTMPICKNFILFVVEFFCIIIARGCQQDLLLICSS